MKSNNQFDYDIWKDENNEYKVLVKNTGEITTASPEVVQYLWAEEKAQYREYLRSTYQETDGSVHSKFLSFEDQRTETADEDCESTAWQSDPQDQIDELIALEGEQQFMKMLTRTQRRVYEKIIAEGMTVRECAERIGTSHPAIMKHLAYIRKKAKKFFD